VHEPVDDTGSGECLLCSFSGGFGRREVNLNPGQQIRGCRGCHAIENNDVFALFDQSLYDAGANAVRSTRNDNGVWLILIVIAH
jgi:hypothetical protein